MRRNLRWIVLAALAITVPALLALAAGAAPHFPTSKISRDPFSDLVGAHATELEPSIQAEPNPARAGSRLAKRSTILTSRQTGRIYDGGASDITTSISVDGGYNWADENLPLTVTGGQATACDGQPGVPSGGYRLYSGSDTVVAYDKRHDVWLDSTLGISGNVIVPAVFVNVGKVRFLDSDPASFMGGPSVPRRRDRVEPADLPRTSRSRAATRRTRTGSRATTGRQQGLRHLLRGVRQQRQRQP